MSESCCLARRKIVIGIIGVLPEETCGVPDSVLADFLDWADQPSGKSLLRAAYCCWCGARQTPDSESRITPPPFRAEDDDSDDEGEEWKK